MLRYSYRDGIRDKDLKSREIHSLSKSACMLTVQIHNALESQNCVECPRGFSSSERKRSRKSWKGVYY